MFLNAYIRARNCDPKSSFGDFIAISHVVDVPTAKRIKGDISDGIIAIGYETEALEILKSKKGGKFIVLKGYPMREISEEMKEYYGVAISQPPNNVNITLQNITDGIVTQNKDLSDEIKMDLLLANISLKYTQSNSVAVSYNGQVIGIGAGQQSRIDCVKLACQKAQIFLHRYHMSILDIIDKFNDNVKRQEKINGIIQYIENDFTELDYNNWKNYLK